MLILSKFPYKFISVHMQDDWRVKEPIKFMFQREKIDCGLNVSVEHSEITDGDCQQMQLMYTKVKIQLLLA